MSVVVCGGGGGVVSPLYCSNTRWRSVVISGTVMICSYYLTKIYRVGSNSGRVLLYYVLGGSRMLSDIPTYRRLRRGIKLLIISPYESSSPTIAKHIRSNSFYSIETEKNPI